MLHSEEESYRGTIGLVTPDGERHTIIVTCRGHGAAKRTWLTLNGAVRTTVVMTREQARKVTEMIQQSAGG